MQNSNKLTKVQQVYMALMSTSITFPEINYHSDLVLIVQSAPILSCFCNLKAREFSISCIFSLFAFLLS